MEARLARSRGLAVAAMAVEFPEVSGHPNRLPFEGCLTVVDVPSDRAPSGARGHRVVLTKEAAESITRRGGTGMMRGRSAASSRRRISKGND
jgi:hypothetical protein